MIKQFWNKTDLLKEVEASTGFRIASITLWTWEKKGRFMPSGYIQNGKQRRPVYDQSKLDVLVTKAREAKEAGKPRISL